MNDTRFVTQFEEPPELGQKAMSWTGCMFEIISVSLFGDEVYVKPLPTFCTDGEWHYHLGKEPRWITLSSLIPVMKPNKSLQGTAGTVPANQPDPETKPASIKKAGSRRR